MRGIDARTARCRGAVESGEWFSRLSEGGRIVDDVQERPWDASDGRVIDRNGAHWLIGFEHAET